MYRHTWTLLEAEINAVPPNERKFRRYPKKAPLSDKSAVVGSSKNEQHCIQVEEMQETTAARFTAATQNQKP